MSVVLQGDQTNTGERFTIGQKFLLSHCYQPIFFQEAPGLLRTYSSIKWQCIHTPMNLTVPSSALHNSNITQKGTVTNCEGVIF